MTRDETVALFEACEAKRARCARGGAGRRQIRRRGATPSRTRPRRRIGTPGPSPSSPNARRWKRTDAGRRKKTSLEAWSPRTPKPAPGWKRPPPISPAVSFLYGGRRGPKRQREKKKREQRGGEPPSNQFSLREAAPISPVSFFQATPRSQAPPSPDAPGSKAPPSPATPRSISATFSGDGAWFGSATFSRRTLLVRKRHLLRRRPVRKRHLLRRAHLSFGSATFSGARPVRKRHLLRPVRAPLPDARSKRHLHRRRPVRKRHLLRRRLVRKRHLHRRRPVRKRHLPKLHELPGSEV